MGYVDMRFFLAIVFLLSLTSTGIAEEADVDSIKNPVKTSKSSIAQGSGLYQKHCAVCHGKKADGNGPSAEGFEVEPWGFKDGEIDDLSDGFLFQQIKNGGVWFEMPPFVLGMKDDEIWSVINYLRSLSKK